MKLVICEDQPRDVDTLRALCREYATGKKRPMQLSAYASGEALLADASVFEADALLLDIYLDGMHGIAVAKALRERGFAGAIVLATCSADHYPEGYQVEALHYLQKPIQRRDFFEAMDRVVRRLPVQEKTISVISERRQRTVPLGNILYVEVRNHQTRLVTTLGVMPLAISLGELEELLDERSFFRCFRSYVVNFAHVTGLADCAFTLSNGEHIPITRRNLTAAENRYMDYLFGGEGTA